MSYAVNAFERAFQNIPGGDSIAHYAGLLKAKFEDLTLPPEAKELKDLALRKLYHFHQMIEMLPPGQNGREWNVYSRVIDPFTDAKPEGNAIPFLEVTIGHFNKDEQRAFHFFKRNSGRTFYAPTDTSWMQVDARSFTFTAHADEQANYIRPVFTAEVKSVTKPGEFDRITSHLTHRLEHHILNNVVLDFLTSDAQTSRPVNGHSNLTL